jgi:hypothetical protein
MEAPISITRMEKIMIPAIVLTRLLTWQHLAMDVAVALVPPFLLSTPSTFLIARGNLNTEKNSQGDTRDNFVLNK